MEYRIEIWQYHDIAQAFESDNIQDVVDWYKEEWHYSYEMGYCSFSVYENNRELSFEEEWELGFY